MCDQLCWLGRQCVSIGKLENGKLPSAVILVVSGLSLDAIVPSHGRGGLLLSCHWGLVFSAEGAHLVGDAWHGRVSWSGF